MDLVVAEPAHGRGIGRDIDMAMVGFDQDIPDADERQVKDAEFANLSLRDGLVAGPETDLTGLVGGHETREGGTDGPETGAGQDRQGFAEPLPADRIDGRAEVSPALAERYMTRR